MSNNITPLPPAAPSAGRQIPRKPAARMLHWRFEIKLKGREESAAGFVQADTLNSAVFKILATMSDNDAEFDGLLVARASTPSGIVLPG